MLVEFVAPKLGLMEEVTVLQWLKEVGDRVTSGEPLVLLETDKANVEVESPATGRLARIAAPGGTVVTSGQVLAEIETEQYTRTDGPPVDQHRT